MRRQRRTMTIALAGVVLVAMSSTPSAGVEDPTPRLERATRSSTRVAPGVRLIRIVDRSAPLRIYVVTMNLSRKTTLDVGKAGKQISARATVGEIAEKYGAVVAINGDFFLHKRVPRPVHLFMEDGRMVQTGIRVGRVFAYAADESAVFMGRPPVLMYLQVPRLHDSWKIDRWNSGPSPVREIVGFTSAGGDTETPPKDSCWAKLLPASRVGWGDVNGRLQRGYTVADTGCTWAAPTVGKHVVLSAPRGSADADRLRTLEPTESVSVSWSLGWPNVADAIAAEPELIDAGAIVAPTGCGSMCGRHPRTAVGVKADGTVVMVVVDGRSTLSRGMTLVELAQFLKGEGVVDAVNLDGGGSSTLVVRGQVINRPSDGLQRPIANALMILPGVDRGQRLA